MSQSKLNLSAEHLEQLAHIIVSAHCYFCDFKGDSYKKISAWLTTENPEMTKAIDFHLYVMSPEDAILHYKGKRLITWLNKKLDNNESIESNNL